MKRVPFESVDSATAPPAADPGTGKEGRWRPASVAAASLLVLLMAIVPDFAGAAAGFNPRSYRAPHNRTLEVSVPSDWAETIDSGRGYPKIDYSSGTPKEFLASLSVLWSGSSDSERSSVKEIRSRLKEKASKTLKAVSAAGREAALQPLESDRVIGYYYAVTDPSPPPGSFRCLTEGEARIEELIVHFTIMTNDPSASQIAALLEMLRKAKQGAPEPAPVTAASLRKIRVAEHGWAIVAALEGFEAQDRPAGYEFDSENRMYSPSGWKWFAANREDGLVVSMFVDEPDIQPTPASCRELYWARIRGAVPGLIKESSLSERPSMAIVEYRVPRLQTKTIELQNFNVYLAKGDSCIDIHLSKENFRPEDSGLFERILQSIQIVPLREATEGEVPGKGNPVN
jgi:hypothetical protein